MVSSNSDSLGIIRELPGYGKYVFFIILTTCYLTCQIPYFMIVLYFRCCHDLLHSLAVKIRAVSRCSCLLIPVFFHAVTTSRTSYDSLSMELFPLFACARHVVHSSAESSTVPIKRASPYKLVRFNSDGTFSPLLRPGHAFEAILSQDS